MTDLVQIALITGATTVSTAVVTGALAVVAASRARRAAERAEKAAHDGKEISKDTATRIDGRMDELLELTRMAAFKAGVLEQKELGDKIAKAVEAIQPRLPTEVQRQEKDAQDPKAQDEPHGSGYKP